MFNLQHKFIDNSIIEKLDNYFINAETSQLPKLPQIKNIKSPISDFAARQTKRNLKRVIISKNFTNLLDFHQAQNKDNQGSILFIFDILDNLLDHREWMYDLELNYINQDKNNQFRIDEFLKKGNKYYINIIQNKLQVYFELIKKQFYEKNNVKLIKDLENLSLNDNQSIIALKGKLIQCIHGTFNNDDDLLYICRSFWEIDIIIEFNNDQINEESNDLLQSYLDNQFTSNNQKNITIWFKFLKSKQEHQINKDMIKNLLGLEVEFFEQTHTAAFINNLQDSLNKPVVSKFRGKIFDDCIVIVNATGEYRTEYNMQNIPGTKGTFTMVLRDDFEKMDGIFHFQPEWKSASGILYGTERLKKENISDFRF